MALRIIILISLTTNILIVFCSANGQESSSASSSFVSSPKTKSDVNSSEKRKCIKVKKCPKNEEFSYCTQTISRAQFCSQKGQMLKQRGDNTSCKEGCVCKDGFLRNCNGSCIPASECNATCGLHEVLNKCPVDCGSDYCPTSEQESSTCDKPEDDECPLPVCKCAFNYRRADNGTCIPTEDCPPFNCRARPNEQYMSCPPICPSDDCSLSRLRGMCPYRIGIRLPCNPKCQCKDGYGRSNGVCVPFADCPNLCPENEEYDSCTQAICRQQNCLNRNDPIACPFVSESSCIKGCVCKDNYYRNANGTCVPSDQCEEPVCDDNEVLDNCPADCPADYCPKSENDNENCPPPDICPKPACKCRINFRRADNGTCIPTRDCPPFDCSSKPNEKYDPCPPLCPTDGCSISRVRGRCPFSIGILLQCNPKCQCKDGYGRSDGLCVPFEECPNLCTVNEEYDPCTEAVCRQQNCSNRNDAIVCEKTDKGPCNKGCVCTENYYRNSNGTCVTNDQCEAGPKCPNPHEEYAESTRIPNCPLLGTCTSIVARIMCDKPETSGCICEGGYYRLNETSLCIPMCECPQMANTADCQY